MYKVKKINHEKSSRVTNFELFVVKDIFVKEVQFTYSMVLYYNGQKAFLQPFILSEHLEELKSLKTAFNYLVTSVHKQQNYLLTYNN